MIGQISSIQGELTWKQKKQFPYQKLLPASDAEGSQVIDFNVDCFTEFDPLKCVIVGYVDETATSPVQILDIMDGAKYSQAKYPEELIRKAQQDLNNLAKELMKHGVQVVRVGKKDWSKRFQINGLDLKGYFCHSPRDIPLCYHNVMYQFPTGLACRLEEYQALEWIQKQLYQKGSKVYDSWKSIRPLQNYKADLANQTYKSETQYFGDAANLLKVGLDIIFLISESATKGCYRIFRKFMQKKYNGRVRVHPLENSYEGVHVDTSITLVGFNKKLQKYIALVDGLQATNPANIPAILRGKNWRLIQVNKYNKEFAYPGYDFVSEHMGLNFFMVNPELAVVSENQLEIKNTLEFYGVKVLSLPIKNACQFDGGFHCVTNDINREDVHGFGKILQSPIQSLSKSELSGLFDPDLLSFLQEKGDIQNWTEICNQNGIFPQYLIQHLSQHQKDELAQKHKIVIEKYSKKSNTS